MTLCGLPLSSLSSSVLFGCFFTFLVFFGFVACESAVCEPGSVEGVVSARASEDSATDTASAAIRESMKFEGIGLLLEKRIRNSLRRGCNRCATSRAPTEGTHGQRDRVIKGQARLQKTDHLHQVSRATCLRRDAGTAFALLAPTEAKLGTGFRRRLSRRW